jgi:ABC-type nitrate/sulfonate/bicarbonate transport system substrate-binding protein
VRWTPGPRGAFGAAAVVCAALCAAGCGEIHTRLTLGRPRPVTVALDGPPSALYAPLYEAQAAGDFAAGALAVKIVSAANGNSLAALESGRAEVAVTSEPELLAARDSGRRLVSIGALTSQPLDAIVSLASAPVGAARQLAGRTVAISGTPLARAQLATVLATARVPARRVHTVAVPAATLGATLTRRGRVAALGGPWPLELAALERAGRPARALALPRAGVPPYSGLVLVVRLGEAHQDGPLLRAFLQSLSRGAAAVAANPAAAAARIARLGGGQNAAYQRAVLALMAPLSASATAAEPFGYQDPLLWQSFGAWMLAHGLLRAAPNAGLAVTNEFLPGQGEATVRSN